jgi:segregation and condensation protein B
LVEVANGYQFRSAPLSAPFVRELVAQRPVRLTRGQLETLALVAYRQPITRPEIDDVRGVDSGSTLKVLLERGLLKILGRKDEPGRPLLYGSAPYFLEFFGMKSMQELPTLKEFTDLTEENRELFRRKTGEIPDLSEAAAAAASGDPGDAATFDDEELMAIANAAKAARDLEPDSEPPESGPLLRDTPQANTEADGAEDDAAHTSADVGSPAFELDDED